MIGAAGFIVPPQMVDHSAKEGDAGIKVSLGSESRGRKFTLSCSRCRTSKLKCDKKEPCMECMKRNVGHLCTKDERQPRAKRVKTDHNNKDPSKSNASQNQKSQADDAAQVIQRFVDGTLCHNADSSVLPASASSLVAPDYSNTYRLNINDPQRQDENFALIREIVDVMPELDMVQLLYEVFVTRCQGPLGNVVHTPTFMKQAETLYECFSDASPEAQAIALFNTFSMDILACHLLALVLALAFHPTPSLLGWSSTPLTLRVEKLRESGIRSNQWRSLASRCIQGRVSLFCGSIASLQAAIMLLLDGQGKSLVLDAILVTAISGAQKLGLHRLGVSKLDVFASLSSSSEDGSSTSTEALYIRTEISIRIWWALVMRDWSRGQTLGYYNIHPSQFNTRMPLHINDDDLCLVSSKGTIHYHVAERPRSDFTMLSYTIHALELAVFTRESIDLRNPLCQAQPPDEADGGAKMLKHLHQRYEKFVAGLPSHFRLGSTVGLTSTGLMAAIPVQRWMLHQQLWSLFLRLHRGSISSQDDQASCQLLAQNIISTQAQIQARCVVCGSLSTNETQLFNAATLLLVDLLSTFKHEDAYRSSVQLSRLMTRDKIREAIELLRTQSDAGGSPYPQDSQLGGKNTSAQRRIVALEAMMKLEEDESRSEEEKNATSLIEKNCAGKGGLKSDSGALRSLKRKIMDIFEELQGEVQNEAAAKEQESSTTSLTPDMFTPSTIALDEFQGIDLLPVLSNDPSPDIWQFLDFTQFPIEYDSFSAMTDLPIPDSSMTFGPSSDMAYSLKSFDM